MNEAPPHDEQAERAILGAILLSDVWLTAATDAVGLSGEDFYAPRNQRVFAAMEKLAGQGDPVDTGTVGGKLPDEDRDYLGVLVSSVPSIANARSYAQIVKHNSRLRETLALTDQIRIAVHEREDDEIARLVGELAAPDRERSRAVTPDKLMDLLVHHLTTEKPAETFPLPFPKLNLATSGGLRRGQVMVIAGWQNDGKSIFALDCADSMVAGTDRKARLYLTEMTVLEVGTRLVARNSKLTPDEAIRGALDAEHTKLVANLKLPPIDLVPAAGWTVDEICRDILKHRPDVAVVDHINRVNLGSYKGNKVNAMDELSAKFNSVAKDNQANCALLLVSHLGRHAEKDKVQPRPRESMLRDTYMIAADADVVCMVYRDRDDKGERLVETEVYFTRNRSGSTTSTQARFDWRNLTFKPLDKTPPQKEMGF